MSQKDAFWAQQSVTQVLSQHGPGTPIKSPLPVTPLPDLTHKSPAGKEAPCDEVKRGKPRRSVGEMQLEMYNKGGHFLIFEEPDCDPNCFPIPKGEDYAKGVKDFRTMEEKGFLISKDGCIFPHEQYGVRGAGATLKGHQRSSFFFTGLVPERAAAAKTGKPLKKGKCARDGDGWPTHSQISHLCHRGSCVRPDHLQIELQVANLRRNFCGVTGSGKCDCGMHPPCVHKYHPSDWVDPKMSYCETSEEVTNALAGLDCQFPFQQLDRDTVKASASSRKRKSTG